MSDEDKEEKLTQKEKNFIDEWMIDFNATRAARDAGYSERTASVIGWENLRKPKIKAEIDRRLDEVRMSKAEVLRRISDLAAGDMADFMEITPMGWNVSLLMHDENGDLILDEITKKPIRNPRTKLIKKLKQKVTTILAKSEDGEDREIIETEIELYPADDALKTLAKHHGLLKDNIELTGAGGGPVEQTITHIYLPDNGRNGSD